MTLTKGTRVTTPKGPGTVAYVRNLPPDVVTVQEPPYPWCHGAPMVADCIAVGYCRRNPNCGE